ncbi:MAG: paraquat-inducible protein A [Magnetococcales bacterium]|nr:paraquat-inducible protein A [Magnetococcales bacterium]
MPDHPWPTRQTEPADQRRTAARCGLYICHVCGRLSAPADALRRRHGLACPRCRAALHPRKPESLHRTLALLVTAAVLYLPANLLPVMTISRFGQDEPTTILQGVQALIAAQLWLLAVVVFAASIVVPMLKISTLGYLIWSVRTGEKNRRRDRTRLYHIAESVGQWSMVDVFLVAVLVSLVDLDFLAVITPGHGATFFAAVVVLTMLATHAFDPRLIWDAAESSYHEQ